jgi:hypothetical protein
MTYDYRLTFEDGPDKVSVAKTEHGLVLRNDGPRGGVRFLGIPTEALAPLVALIDPPTGPLSSFDYELIADALDVLDPDGSEATRRKQELEAWARQMAATGRGYLPEGRPGETAPPIRVAVALEGGIVQGAVADRPGVAVTVLDYDTDGADADRVWAIPQDNGGTENAYVAEHDAEHDPAFIDAAQAAKLADPEEAIAELRERAGAWAKDNPKLAAEELARAEEIEAELASDEAEAAA